MSNAEFTKVEALNLRKVLLKMMKEKRIFLAKIHNITDKKLFEVLNFQKIITDLYKRIQAEATRKISSGEKSLGLKKPKLKDDQVVVRCSRYSEGLEIVYVYPLEKFLAFAPKTEAELREDIFSIYYPKGRDSITALDWPEVEVKIDRIYELISLDLKNLKDKRGESVIILKTLFQPSYNFGIKELYNKTKDFVNNERGLAYLFYKSEIADRTVRNGYVVFNLEENKRTQIANLLNYVKPRMIIQNDEDHGFDCSVLFAFVT